jgi:hypothetical protein
MIRRRVIFRGTLQSRANPNALIGDRRNDGNVIVSQLHAAFLRFHNRMADVMPGAVFDDLQRLVRWHYQWVVLHDFLSKIVIKDVIHDLLPETEEQRVYPGGVLGGRLSVRPFDDSALLAAEHYPAVADLDLSSRHDGRAER